MESYLTAPCFSFLTCKMGIILALRGRKKLRLSKGSELSPVSFRETPAAFLFHSGWGRGTHVHWILACAFLSTGRPQRYCAVWFQSKANIAINIAHDYFGFAVHVKVIFILYCGLLSVQ